MSLFKNLFGGKKEVVKFIEGDIFYTFFSGQFHLYKLLRSDDKFGTYHLLCYAPSNKLPDKSKADELDVLVYHSPIAQSGFEGAKLFIKSVVNESDLIGYYEYLKQTQLFEELIPIANRYYNEGYRLTDLKKNSEAIEQYSKAIDLLPNFYEAIDNRAFCKMNLAQWNEAIEDFKLSLLVNPISTLAEFSIGECYLKMRDYKNAIKQFEKALIIDPENQLSKDFLQKAILLNNG